MRLRFLLTAAALLFTSPIARADNYTTFTLTSSYLDGGTIDGTIVLDTTTDAFSSVDLTAAGFSSSTPDGAITSIDSQGTADGEYYLFASGPNVLQLELPVTTLAGYGGSVICTLSLPPACPADPSFYSFLDFATSGTLEPMAVTAATPEPSSIFLLGSGLLGIAGFVRRRVA
jgi:hypothetical protein